MEGIKKKQKRLWLSLLTTVFLSGQSLPLKAQTVLNTIQETGVLKVAIREDAAPFGYLNSANELQGYCLDFIALLEQKLEAKLPRNAIAIKLLKSTTRNRFDLVENGLVDLECGSNTIRELPSPNVTFSRPFFETGTQFLISQEQAEKFNLEGDLANLTLPIGVIYNTSNAELVKKRYPSAELLSFSGVTARNRGVQAVQQGKIIAMASDGILLRAEAAKQNLPVEEYAIVPEQPLSRDYYGMIISGQDEQWKAFVDSVIVSPESQKLFQQWFNFIESFPQQVN